MGVGGEGGVGEGESGRVGGRGSCRAGMRPTLYSPPPTRITYHVSHIQYRGSSISSTSASSYLSAVSSSRIVIEAGGNACLKVLPDTESAEETGATSLGFSKVLWAWMSL